MSAIYRRELKANFFSMTGTIFIAFALVFMGLYCSNVTFAGSNPNLEQAIIVGSFYSLLAVPILTMRSFSEERHSKTDQLLYSLPLTTGDIVLGKFFAMMTVHAVPTGVLCLFPLVSTIFCTEGSLNYAMIYSTILCYFLLGCAVIAICTFLSSLTESQVISAIMGIAAVLLLYFMSSIAGMVPQTASLSFAAAIIICLAIAYIVWLSVKNLIIAGVSGLVLIIGCSVAYAIKASLFEGLLGKLLSMLAVFEPIYNFAYGIFDLTTIIYYLSVITVFVFLTVQSVEKRRWN